MLGMIGSHIWNMFIREAEWPPQFSWTVCHLTLWNTFKSQKLQVGGFLPFEIWAVGGIWTEIDEERDQASE